MKKIFKGLLGGFLTLALCFGTFANLNDVGTKAAVTNITSRAVSKPAGQQDDIQDGVTLHCWNWSYKSIEANMELIAASGYTAIQTSPIQQSKEATKSYSMDAWWLYYQPMGFIIDNTGNSALGTKAEFISMCNTAHQYGVKVIVDVVANHLGNQTSNNLSTSIPSDIRDDASCWHDITKNTTNYDSRYEITQFCMNGVPDLNTSNTKIQNYVITYLKECIDAGADGFRFDAAKHIELPIDTDYCASDFWPNVINAATTYATSKGKDLYCYGELLDTPGGGIPASAYTTYMSITDNSWGNQLRGNVAGGNASGYSYGYHKGNGVYADKLVLWAESHDTFAGGESKDVSTDNINKTWALVATRSDAMGLYFARPGYTDLNKTPMGTGAVTGWADAEVAAINKFHNAFAGQTEWLANEGNIAYCERGTSGVILVNCSGTNATVNVTANTMVNGTYKDQITGNTFTVSGGRIKGDIGGTGIAVVYNAISTNTSKKNIAYIELPGSWGSKVSCYAYSADGSSNGDWPGVAMTKVSGNLYKYEVPSNISNPRVIFYSSDSNRYPADLQPGLSLYGNMIYKSGQWTVYSTDTGSNDENNSTTENSTQSETPTRNETATEGENPTKGDSLTHGSSDNGASGNGDLSGDNSGGNVNDNDSEECTDKSGETTKATDDATEENPTEESTEKNGEGTENSEASADELKNDEGGEDNPETTGTSLVENNGENKPDKKFPWPAVVIPIVVIGAGSAVCVYFYTNKKHCS